MAEGSKAAALVDGFDPLDRQVDQERFLAEVCIRISAAATCAKPRSGSYQLLMLHCPATLINTSFYFFHLSKIRIGQQSKEQKSVLKIFQSPNVKRKSKENASHLIIFFFNLGYSL